MIAHPMAKPEIRDRIVLVGYPGFGPGKSISIKRGEITSFWMKSGVRRFNISAGIVAGNSGGPVLDTQNYVVGIAVTGADRDDSVDQTHDHGSYTDWNSFSPRRHFLGPESAMITGPGATLPYLMFRPLAL